MKRRLAFIVQDIGVRAIARENVRRRATMPVVRAAMDADEASSARVFSRDGAQAATVTKRMHVLAWYVCLLQCCRIVHQLVVFIGVLLKRDSYAVYRAARCVVMCALHVAMIHDVRNALRILCAESLFCIVAPDPSDMRNIPYLLFRSFGYAARATCAALISTCIEMDLYVHVVQYVECVYGAFHIALSLYAMYLYRTARTVRFKNICGYGAFYAACCVVGNILFARVFSHRALPGTWLSILLILVPGSHFSIVSMIVDSLATRAFAKRQIHAWVTSLDRPQHLPQTPCPACRTPIEDMAVVHSLSTLVPPDSRLCSICHDRSVECVLLPCMHHSFCAECVEQWMRHQTMLPFTLERAASCGLLSRDRRTLRLRTVRQSTWTIPWTTTE